MLEFTREKDCIPTPNEQVAYHVNNNTLSCSFHIRILPTTAQKIAFDETPVQIHASDRLPPISHELLRDTCVRYRPNEQVSTGSTAIVEHPNQTAGCMNKTDTYILTKFLNGPNQFISHILEVPRWGLGGPCRPRGHRRWRRLYLRRT